MTLADRNLGGTGTYARSLASALEERDDLQVDRISTPRRGVPATLDWLLRGANWQLSKKRPALLHCPAVVVPWNVPVPYLVTVHDHSSRLFPEDHPAEWMAYERWLLPGRLRSAAMVLTGTEFARRQLVKAFGLDPMRVTTTPYGVRAVFAEAGRAHGRGGRRGQPELLFPGAPTYRKNLEAVLEAMAGDDAAGMADARLSISGATAAAFPAQVERIRGLGLEQRVEWLGQLSEMELAARMAAAAAVVYPSRYEGFGFPALEAMAAGVPLVASTAACLPEVIGDGGLLVAPDDVAGLREALNAVLTRPELASRLAEAGRRRAADFTWQRCADRTVECYRAVLSAAS